MTALLGRFAGVLINLTSLPEAGKTPMASQLALQGAEVGHVMLLLTAP